MLQDKIDIIEALKAPTADPKNMRLRIKGTDIVLKINIEKLHKAISFRNTDGTPEEEEKKEH